MRTIHEKWQGKGLNLRKEVRRAQKETPLSERRAGDTIPGGVIITISFPKDTTF